MNPRLLLFWLTLTLFISFVGLTNPAGAQTPTPAAPAPTAYAIATPLPANAIVTCAGGIQLVFVPGPNPVLTAVATDGDLPPGLAVATARTVRFIDKDAHDVDPASIKPTDRLHPIGGSGPNGLILQQVVVERN